MKWNCEIELLNAGSLDSWTEGLIATKDEDVSDEEVFYYVEDEEELRWLMIPKNCVDFLILNYELE